MATQHRSITVFENHKEAIVYFVHVYWSPDETEFGVVSTGLNIWYFGCDARTGREIPFERIRNGLAQSIRASYQVPDGEDPR